MILHTPNCSLLQKDVKMAELDHVQQDYVLNCPSPDHDSVRLIFGYHQNLDDFGHLVRKM